MAWTPRSGFPKAADDVAALEAAVVDCGIGVFGLGGFDRAAREPCVRRSAVAIAEIEIGQAAVEEARRLGADRMAVPQQNPPVQGAKTVELGGEGVVTGSPEGLDPAGGLVSVRLLTGQVDGFVIEGRQRTDPGVVGAGIERRVVRRAVEVHDVTRMRCRDHGRAEADREGVEPVDMPVRVGYAPGDRRHRIGDVRRNVRSDVGQADDQRRAAAMQSNDLHPKAPSRTRQVRSATRTRRCLASMRSRSKGMAIGSLASQRSTMLS